MTEPQPAGRDEVEVAHEALIRHWPRLRQWLDQDRATLLLRESVREAAQEWDRHGHDESYLAHRGRRLAEVEALTHHPRFTLNAQEQAYLDAAVGLREREEREQEAQRQRELDAQRERAELAEAARREAEQRVAEQAVAARRLRRRLIIAVGLGALALLAAVGAFRGFQQAGEQRGVAEEQREAALAAAGTAEAESTRAAEQAGTAVAERGRALARQLQAQARDLADEEFDVAVLLGLEAERRDKSIEAWGSLLTVLQANPRFQRYLPGDDEAVNGLALSPDGQLLAAGSDAGLIRLWDVADGTSRVISQGRLTRITDLAFNADGRVLAAAGCAEIDPLGDCTRGETVLLDVPSGNERSRFGCEAQPSDLGLSPDGAFLFAICESGVIGWELAGDADDQPRFRQDGPTILATSPDAERRFLAFNELGDAVVLLNTETGHVQELQRPLPVPAGLSVFDLAFSPDGEILAVSYSDGTVSLWETASATLSSRSLSATSTIWQIAFSPDGATIVGANSDGTVVLWDVATGRPLGGPIAGHRGGITSFAVGAAGALWTGGADGRLAAWDTRAEYRVGHPLFKGMISDAAFSADGNRLAAITTRIELWDLQSLQKLNVTFAAPRGLPSETFYPRCLAFSPDGKTLAAGTIDGSIVRWDVESGRQKGAVLKGDGPESTLGCTLAYSPDGKLLAFSLLGNDGVSLWDPTAAQRRIDTVAAPFLKRVLFSPDNQKLVTLTYPHEAGLWDVTTVPARAISLGAESEDVVDAAFAGGDQMLMILSRDGTVRRGDVSANPPAFERVARITADANRLAVRPDGRLLAAGGQGGELALFDAASGRSVAALTESRMSTPVGMTFSPDGRWLATWSLVPSPALVLWDVGSASWQEQACRLTNRNLSREEWRRYIGPDEPYEPTCTDLPAGDGALATPAPEERIAATPVAAARGASGAGSPSPLRGTPLPQL